ncbi:MAG: TIGR04282 family arsenosugar biosynthesis glycosyltransferase [Cyclobacteriaceae bacterium]
MSSKRVLLIFYRNPEKGKVKTRLASTVGDDVALKLYLQLAEHTKNESSGLQGCDKIVFYSNAVEENDIWHEDAFQKQQQLGDDLGQRMQNAFEYAFAAGYDQACIIGTDCLELKSKILTEAFEQLNNLDAVVGPAKDGGYYLLGLSQIIPSVFLDKQWSSNSVLKDTIEDFKKLRLSFIELDTLADVDTEDDLPIDWRSKLT